MVIPSNAIKQYKSPVSETNEYRMYAVYPAGNIFIFECWDCTATESGGGVGTMKARDEFATAAEAVARFAEYIQAWEPDANVDLS